VEQRWGLPSRAEDELRAAAQDVNYEMMMLRECSQRLRPPPPDPVLRNALIESYLVHLRNLLHFFRLAGKEYTARHSRNQTVMAFPIS